MKRILKQLWQLIFKHKKRLIYWVLAFFVGQICFFNLWWVWIQSEVYAADGETATQREEFSKIVTEKAKLFDLYRKTGYVLLYPVIFLAWKLVDNSFVYWEVFGFDAVLWKLWNMVRNFANFWLWFIFLYYIFRFLIKNDKNKDWKRLIWRAMIAWIGIQASWFIMAALIDVSTILIYWIWGLPLSILWWNWQSDGKNFDPYVLKTVVTVDADDVWSLGVYLTSTSGDSKGYISDCVTKWVEDENQKGYIVAPRIVYYWNWIKWEWAQYVETKSDMCHYFWSVYKLGPLPEGITWRGGCKDLTTCKDNQTQYYSDILKVLQKKNDARGMLPIWVTGDNSWLDEDNKNICKNGFGCKKLSELMTGDVESYVWVFSTLYSSLLEAWRKMVPMDTGASNYVQFLSIFMALAHVIAIWIPLLAALLVFIMRIWVIWVAIVIFPMIILLEAFWLMDKIKNKTMELFKLKNLIWIIFAPAVIAFAVSMSTVLVRLIEKINYKPIATDTIVLWWLVEMNLAWFSVWLTELIIAVMWAAISWYIVRLAVVGSSKLWEKISKLEGLATSALWSVPIVPVVWKDANWKLTWELASVSWVKNAVNNKIQSVKSEFTNSDTEAVEQLFSRNRKSVEAGENTINHTSQTFVDWLKSSTITSDWRSSEIEITGTDWKPQKMIFNNLDWAQKEKIIEKINSVGGDLLEKIWKATPNIDIDDKVKYVFKEWKFERQETQK